MLFHKRKFLFGIFVFIISVYFALVGAGCTASADENVFTVKFINSGSGVCVLFNLPDGKTMLFDAPFETEKEVNEIKQTIKDCGKDKIDYLLLPCPKEDNNVGASLLADNIEIDAVYIPNLNNYELFPDFAEQISVLKNHGVCVEKFAMSKVLSGERWFAAFLSPDNNNPINDIFCEDVSETDVKDLSPVVYLDICGVSFVFSFEASVSQEKFVVDNYKSGIYKLLFDNNISVNLNEVDFLSLGGGGSSNSSCEDYLKLLVADNIVIPVNKKSFGSVSTKVLERIELCCPDSSVLRTDYFGNISIKIEENGSYVIRTGENI